ncbi:hypothetical protein, partial [Klebsiella pneumoniae]|uniref:hypothetical protein n=1 Tax=Klebsiella pneumoniae TaxID=573 RepID=UPI001D0D3156
RSPRPDPKPAGISRRDRAAAILLARGPGVQGATVTGRPLCAPGAMSDITQTINRERKLR